MAVRIFEILSISKISTMQQDSIEIEKWFKTSFKTDPPFVIYEFCESGVLSPTLKRTITAKLNRILYENNVNDFRLGLTGVAPEIVEQRMTAEGKYKIMFLLYRSTSIGSLKKLELHYKEIYSNNPLRVTAKQREYYDIKKIAGNYFFFLLV